MIRKIFRKNSGGKGEQLQDEDVTIENVPEEKAQIIKIRPTGRDFGAPVAKFLPHLQRIIANWPCVKLHHYYSEFCNVPTANYTVGGEYPREPYDTIQIDFNVWSISDFDAETYNHNEGVPLKNNIKVVAEESSISSDEFYEDLCTIVNNEPDLMGRKIVKFFTIKMALNSGYDVQRYVAKNYELFLDRNRVCVKFLIDPLSVSRLKKIYDLPSLKDFSPIFDETMFLITAAKADQVLECDYKTDDESGRYFFAHGYYFKKMIRKKSDYVAPIKPNFPNYPPCKYTQDGEHKFNKLEIPFCTECGMFK